MEEEQKLEKPPTSGNKDTKFSFSFSNKKLLGYVMLIDRRGWSHLHHSHIHTPYSPPQHITYTPSPEGEASPYH